MPKIACPGCEKQYSLPESAAGKVATCKACGKKFRVGRSSSVSKRAEPSRPAKKQAVSVPTTAAASTKPSADPFWDDSLPEQAQSKRKPATPRGTATQATASHPALEPKKKPKKKKKKRKVSWGVDWGKVGGGLLTFLIAGGLTAGAAMTTGRIYLWGAGVAIVGLFTALSGLMGEEGVW